MAMFEYNGEHKNEKLQDWLMTHQPSDNMVYKKAWWDYLIFIRDKIISNPFEKNTNNEIQKHPQDFGGLEDFYNYYNQYGGDKNSESALEDYLYEYFFDR